MSEWGDGFILNDPFGLRVIVDCRCLDDGSIWLHVSYSRAKHEPSHTDTVKVKQAFFGNGYAYAIFPPSACYVNIHRHCLHLWGPLHVDMALPEFSATVEGIGLSI